MGTNQTIFAVIWVKKRQKRRFLKPEKLQDHSNEEKERRKRKSEEKERRRREKSNGCTLSFIMATLEIVFGRKKFDGARKVIPAVMQRKQYIYMINSSTLYGRI